MFDAVDAFTKQFTPVDDGYVYYPSRKSGGKLVTADEYQKLVADWERTAGRRGVWKAAGLALVAVLIWTIISQSLALPDWTDWIPIIGCVAALSAWMLWASLAPRRLVRGRPDSTPPRRVSEARREARSMLSWPFVILVTVASGAVFIGCLSAPEPTIGWWARMIGSGLFFGVYSWIAVQKFRDNPLVTICSVRPQTTVGC